MRAPGGGWGEGRYTGFTRRRLGRLQGDKGVGGRRGALLACALLPPRLDAPPRRQRGFLRGRLGRRHRGRMRRHRVRMSARSRPQFLFVRCLGRLLQIS